MADPILNMLSLTELSRQYTVFEKDQVLTHDQLNSVAAYLNDQLRLTRVELLGVGIVGGLDVTQADDRVTVRKGVGVTTDGDLLVVQEDAVYAAFRPYGSAAPRYAPLYVNDTMRAAFELLISVDGAADAQPLAALPVSVADRVAVLLMESCQNDSDLCSGTDCDNLGKTAVDTQRVLLVSREDAAALLFESSTAASAAAALPELSAVRPTLQKSIATPEALVNVYVAACNSTHETLLAQLGTLHARLPTFTTRLFGGDPAPDWAASLVQHRQAHAGQVGEVQYYYDLLKDVVDTWNELRECLLRDDSLLCPDLNAFPKHLVLGDLTDATQHRTGLYPSPLTGCCREERAHAEFLARKLDAMVRGFTGPVADAVLRVVPSNTETESLEERAIPYYYRADLRDRWNFRLSRQKATGRIRGYDLGDDGSLVGQLGRYDFFRVEGHVGQQVRAANASIEKAIVDHNLPFAVRAVLLDEDHKKVVVRPPVRFTDLHRFHQILRSDLLLQLDDAQKLNTNLSKGLDEAIRTHTISETNVSTSDRSRYVEVAEAVGQTAPVLAKNRYADYVTARAATDWRVSLKSAVNAAAGLKASLADVVKTDYSNAFDSLVTNNHPAWLDWADTLIKSKDDHEDAKLTFPIFCAEHPAVEHLGGATRGGTFVLIYDSSGKVIGDCALPYRWVETAEAEQPVQLTPPDIRGSLVDRSFRFQPPLEDQFKVRLDLFEAKLKPQWTDPINDQKEYLRFVTNAAQAFGGFPKSSTGPLVADPPNVTHPVLNDLLSEVARKTIQVQKAREIAADPHVTDEVQTVANSQRVQLESDLADLVVSASKIVVDEKLEMAPNGDGGKALEVISRGMEKIAAPTAVSRLQAGMGDAQIARAGVQSDALTRAVRLRGF